MNGKKKQMECYFGDKFLSASLQPFCLSVVRQWRIVFLEHENPQAATFSHQHSESPILVFKVVDGKTATTP